MNTKLKVLVYTGDGSDKRQHHTYLVTMTTGALASGTAKNNQLPDSQPSPEQHILYQQKEPSIKHKLLPSSL